MTAFGRAKEDRPTPPEVVCQRPKSPGYQVCFLNPLVQLESLCRLAGHFHGAVDLWLRLGVYWHDYHTEELSA